MLDDINKLVSLAKRRGFIFPGSEIYGGLSSIWDYGPLGVELKNNLKSCWWKDIVYAREDIEGLDTAILMHPRVWEVSGHVKGFYDKFADCKSCKKRFRCDEIAGDAKKKSSTLKCPFCGSNDITSPRRFNLMFKTHIGSLEERENLIYLRPETAQGIFVNFANVLVSVRKKLPFGIAQIGKAFRNEVTTGNFTFRSREFEQMELEYFVKPEDAKKYFQYWVDEREKWYVSLGIRKINLRIREHKKNELAHYAKACVDIEYKFPFGWSELEGVANRGDFDLREHSKFSAKDLNFYDQSNDKRYFPFIIEPSGGVDRASLAFLVDAYREEVVRDRKRVFLKLHKDLAPVKLAVFPLLKTKSELVEIAKKIVNDFGRRFKVIYDDTAAIGRLYRRQDEIGTPFCITVDTDTSNDNKVTVRERDTMEQERISRDKLKQYILQKYALI